MKKKKRKEIERNCDRIFELAAQMTENESYYGFRGDVDAEGRLDEIGCLLTNIQRCVREG